MAIEIINSIKNAEAEAAAIKSSAKEQAKSIIADAKEQAKKQSDYAQQEAYNKANKVISSAKTKADEMSVNNDSEFDLQLAEVKKKAESKLDVCADFILKEILGV